MKSLNKMLLIMFMFYAVPRIAYGADAEIDELRNRIEYLEKKVEAMNQTLIKMMAILDSSSSVSIGRPTVPPSIGRPTVPPSIGLPTVTPDRLKWEDKQNWRKLRSGMSKDEVTDLLGEPDRIDKFPSFEVWSYGDYGSGFVHFSSPGKAESWSEP